MILAIFQRFYVLFDSRFLFKKQYRHSGSSVTFEFSLRTFTCAILRRHASTDTPKFKGGNRYAYLRTFATFLNNI